MTIYDIVEGDGELIRSRIESMLLDGRLNSVLPELTALIPKPGVKGHKDNFWHTVQVIAQTHDFSNGNEDLKVAALMHDMGKAATARFVEGKGWTFHNHENVSAVIIDRVFDRQNLSREKAEYVKKIVLFAGRAKEITKEGTSDSAVRRFAKEAENDRALIADAMLFACADITTKFEDKKILYRKNLQDLYERIIQVLEADEAAKWRMTVDAHDIMKRTGLKPGRDLGRIKKQLEEMVKSGEIKDEPEIILNKAEELLLWNQKV